MKSSAEQRECKKITVLHNGSAKQWQCCPIAVLHNGSAKKGRAAQGECKKAVLKLKVHPLCRFLLENMLTNKNLCKEFEKRSDEEFRDRAHSFKNFCQSPKFI